METNTLASALSTIAAQFEAAKDRQAEVAEIDVEEKRLCDLIARHKKALARLEERRSKAMEQIHQANPLFYGRYLKPLVDAVLTQFPGMAAEIKGPMGLGNTSSVSIYDPLARDQARLEQRLFHWRRLAKGENDDSLVGWLQFRYDAKSGAIGYVDITKSTGQFPPGSLGDKNALNYETVPLTNEMAIEELAQLFRRGAGGGA